jgi:hypothetical protein
VERCGLRDRAGWDYWASEQALYKGIAVNAPVRRRPNGTLLPGFTANAGGRPRALADALKEKYRNRLPELMDRLFQLTTPNNPPMVQIAAIRALLDRIMGKSTISIDAVHTNLDIGQTVREMYKNAMIRASKSADGATDGGN